MKMTDESAIRELQQTWFRATMEGDIATVSNHRDPQER